MAKIPIRTVTMESDKLKNRSQNPQSSQSRSAKVASVDGFVHPNNAPKTSTQIVITSVRQRTHSWSDYIFLVLSWFLFIASVGFFSAAGFNVYAEGRRAQWEIEASRCRELIADIPAEDRVEFGLYCPRTFALGELFGESRLEEALKGIESYFYHKQQELSLERDETFQRLSEEVSWYNIYFEQVKIPPVQIPTKPTQNVEKDLEIYALTDAQLQEKKAVLDNVLQAIISEVQRLSTRTPESIVQLPGFVNIQKQPQNMSMLYESIPEILSIIRSQETAIFGRVYLDEYLSQLQIFETFDNPEFTVLVREVEYENTKLIETGEEVISAGQVDEYIRNFAESRGYEQRAEATKGSLQYVSGIGMQPKLAQQWLELEKKAQSKGYQLEVVSGYRSWEDQKNLFVSRYREQANAQGGREFSDSEIIRGDADDVLNTVLDTTAFPGYSKHHLGYTIDIIDAGNGLGLREFRKSPAYDWLVRYNFVELKQFGMIPSYPDNGGQYGPQPEEWEYVWVGQTVLKFSP